VQSELGRAHRDHDGRGLRRRRPRGICEQPMVSRSSTTWPPWSARIVGPRLQVPLGHPRGGLRVRRLDPHRRPAADLRGAAGIGRRSRRLRRRALCLLLGPPRRTADPCPTDHRRSPSDASARGVSRHEVRS
jgi:hypothetical protein